jgi:hypothetical protein
MSQATLNGVQSTPRKSSKAATIPRETDKKDRSASTQPKVEVRDTIWKAAERGNTEAVATFLKKKKSLINAQNESGHTAIHMAALHNCWGVVELLVQQGVDLTVSDNSGWSIFHFAASGRNEKLFRLILEQEKIPSGTHSTFFSSNPDCVMRIHTSVGRVSVHFRGSLAGATQKGEPPTQLSRASIPPT